MDQLQPIVMQSQLEEQRTNPLLRRIRLPGESFTLPSRGCLYPEGEVLSHDTKDGEVHVHPMTAIDELALKSVDKLFSGDAVKEVFQRCIPQVLSPSKLFAKDVDFLLTALRKVTYGPTVEITYTHSCDDAKEHKYDIPLDTFLRGSQSLNPATVETRFTYNVDGQKVRFRPATYEDIIKLHQYDQNIPTDLDHLTEDQKLQLKLQQILYRLSIIIDNVDGVTERPFIMEWMEALPVSWLADMSMAAEKTTDWGVTFDVTITCEDCGTTVTVPTTLNPISFFI